ncbi:MAG: nucleoside-diphosphate sugar epimerase/dehydratase [Candidatus Paceibacterota bacterium]
MIKKTPFTRTLFFLFFDFILISFSVFFAFFLRFEGNVPYEYIEGGMIGEVVILSLLFCLPLFYLFKLYSFSWTFVSSMELKALLKATFLGFFFTGFSIFILQTFEGFPRSTLVISYLLIFIFCGAVRFSKRFYLETFKKNRGVKRKTLIVGAGEAGEQLLRGIIQSKESFYNPVGFVDDSVAKQGILIHGLKVFGKMEDIPKIVKKEAIEEMIVALSFDKTFAIKRAVELGRMSGIKKIKIVPPIEEIMKGEISVGNLKEVDMEDLLKRDIISLDLENIEKFIKNRRVFITGGAGSIGFELVCQIARLNPSLLLVLDQDETGIFNVSKELEKFSGFEKKCIVGDVKDKEKIESIFEEFKPEIVFHAAAYKHVGLMEEYPEEAIKNNIFGTKIIAEAAAKNNVEKFIMISTDKAVNPTSVMGMTKRFGEIICRMLNGNTKFISVRFGNVLGSRGSVIPLFKEQIKRGGPVEVTHPDMKRYFMATEEAVALVIQAAQMGEGGEVFVLDMGEPVKIYDLAKEMIRLSGFEPDKDIAIVFTKASPGEKLFEEILTEKEGTVATKNRKIFKANQEDAVDKEKLSLFLDKMKEGAEKEKIKVLMEDFLNLN